MTVSADQQALFVVHHRMLREAVDWLDSTHAPLKGVGSRMLMLLASRIVQLGAAVQSLCEAGHAGEAAPTARAMISACVTLVYIAEEPDNRAAAYLQTEQFKRKYRIARIHEEQAKAEAAGKRLIVSTEELAQIDLKDPELTAIEDKRLVLLAKNGVVPTRLGARQDVVSGLSDSKLFDQMNAMHWYLSYYALFSDEIHVSANTLYMELVEQLSGQSLIGAKFENPLHILLASREMVINALEQIDRAFNLNQRDKLEAIDAPMRARLGRLPRRSGAHNISCTDATAMKVEVRAVGLKASR
jgi:hypothetical protein